MCGILGQFSKWESQLDERDFSSALERLVHRGPDHGAVKTFVNGFLGHRRLSIIDLSDEANQPFSLPDEPDLSIVYNGEIYNFGELGRNLAGMVTRSDTEVILRGYATEGLDFFHRLRGMYAFVILDTRGAPKLIGYRDPAGIKPLYYAYSEGSFVFGSEIKAVKPLVPGGVTIHRDVIKAYLSLGYCPEPYTAYSEIRALSPGTAVLLDLNDFTSRFTALSSYDFRPNDSISDPVKESRDLLRQAVSRNVVSDVPVIFSLSGGIDSSLILALACEKGAAVKSITVSFDDNAYNEVPTAKRFVEALKIEGLFADCNEQGSLSLLNKLVNHFDQPFADSSLIPFYFLSKVASRHAKVLIGGDGGDEIQAGYSNFITLPKIHRYRGIAPLVSAASRVVNGQTKRVLKKLAALMQSDSDDEIMFLRESWIYPQLKLNGHKPFLFDEQDGLSLYASCFASDEQSPFSERLTKDVFYRRMLSDYLRKTDMMSMINSIEYRVPMLDEDLVKYSLSIPLDKKIAHGRGKRILREIHNQYFPSDTSQRSKSGFSIPLDIWLSSEDFIEIEKVLSTSNLIREFVNETYVATLFRALKNTHYIADVSRAGVYQQILIFYSLHLWLDQFQSMPSNQKR